MGPNEPLFRISTERYFLKYEHLTSLRTEEA